MEYNEGYYYEFIEHGKSDVIRFISRIGENKHEYYNLLSNESRFIHFEGKDLINVNNEYSKTIPFGLLSIRWVLGLKNSGKSLFEKFINNVTDNLNKKLELKFDESKKEYFLKYKHGSKEIVQFLNNDINDFFNKIEKILDIKLSLKQKEEFLIEQFS